VQEAAAASVSRHNKRLYNRLCPSVHWLVSPSVPILLTSKLLCPRRACAWFEFLLFTSLVAFDGNEIGENNMWRHQVK
jgi:hypothetical protein